MAQARRLLDDLRRPRPRGEEAPNINGVIAGSIVNGSDEPTPQAHSTEGRQDLVSENELAGDGPSGGIDSESERFASELGTPEQGRHLSTSDEAHNHVHPSEISDDESLGGIYSGSETFASQIDTTEDRQGLSSTDRWSQEQGLSNGIVENEQAEEIDTESEEFASQIDTSEYRQRFITSNEGRHNQVLQNGIAESGQNGEISSNNARDYGYVSSIGAIEEGRSFGMGFTDTAIGRSDRGGGANHPVLNEEDEGSGGDSGFGDTESNGDSENDTEALSDGSNDGTFTGYRGQYRNRANQASEPGDQTQNDGASSRSRILRQLDIEVRGGNLDSPPTELPRSTSGNREWNDLEYDSEESAPVIRQNSFLRRLITENNRLPARFDPEMMFDENWGTSGTNRGPFSAPGQIWEDSPYDELGSSLIMQLRMSFQERHLGFPPPLADGSDENKENIPPQHQVQLSNTDDLEGGTSNSIHGSRGRFNLISGMREQSYRALGSLMSLSSRAID
ncbi:predicted protein [Uncinocarpus reesii 1704]|uniref:Uncharacterized protein n=1 Tax=Uncinocarpus reesii (strain UAMH 1704) TaxID=336963 RepID=C4JJI8_UNCRE|nr:uncharacterized protein UREG_01795 [Uncinocarpus reesii 1704]EEP76946.1 predicted protein [Uncinocarpus reesii 1704]